MINRWKIKIPVLTGDKERTAYVYLPTTYFSNPNRRYPVMYMFDGHNLFTDEEATFGRSWRLGDFLDFTDTQLIVAAVECNTEGNGRLEEYSPSPFRMPNGDKIKGKGKTYMDWLVGEFKPYIDQNYRTMPERETTAIAGSSMGGLMTIFALTKYSKTFSKGAALSPSLWVNGTDLMPFLKTAKYPPNTTLYMDYGTKEFSNHETQLSTYAETTAFLIKKRLAVTSRIVLGGTHSEASWEKQIPVFMETLGFFPEER